VKRLREKHTLELYLEEGNVFVLSATRKGKEWIISEQQQGCEEQAEADAVDRRRTDVPARCAAA
jgi:hypothetical protein